MAGSRIRSALIETPPGSGMHIRDSLYAMLPSAFVKWYRHTFRGTRMIYGHWSGGLYTRAVGTYHRQVAVLQPPQLDEQIERYFEARRRRIGGALVTMRADIERLKQQVTLQTFENAQWDQDLPGHTRNRDTNSIAIALMCGAGARPNDLGPVAPLPEQLRELVSLVADACVAVKSPAERFMTHSEAADNLDYPRTDDLSAPNPPYGFRTTCEVWDLEAWIDVETGELAAPLHSPRPAWTRLGDWLRDHVVRTIVGRTKDAWKTATPS